MRTPTGKIAAACCIALVAGSAQAEPRFAARYGQNCTLCHQNPTGAGLRSLYASQLLVPTEMVMRPKTEQELGRIHPDVSPSVTVGTDLRTLHVYATENQPTRNFLQMESSLYASFTVDDRFSANLTYDPQASVDLYALAWVLPGSGYIKAGRFTPVFGWRFADHKAFTRTRLGFDQPGATDTGIEIGFYPRRFAFWAAILNGEPGGNPGFDENQELAWTASALVHLHGKPLGAGLGGSFWMNAVEPGPTTGRRTKGGPYGYLRWGRFAWLWEVDASQLKTSGGRTTALVTSHELSWQVRPGLDLLAAYDYEDPNLDLKSGTRARYGVGAEVLPVAFVAFEGALRYSQQAEGQDVTGPDFWRTEIQLHLYY